MAGSINTQSTTKEVSQESSAGANSPLQALERELVNSQETVSLLQGKIEALESQIALLKHEKHLQMEKYEDQITSKDSMIMSLHVQLEEKATTVAQVVHKMHQMQRALQRGALLTQQEQSLLVPLPPKEPPLSENGVPYSHRINKITRRVKKPANVTGINGSPNVSAIPPSHSALSNESFSRLEKTSLTTASLPSVQFVPNPVTPPTANRLSHSYDATPIRETPSPTFAPVKPPTMSIPVPPPPKSFKSHSEAINPVLNETEPARSRLGRQRQSRVSCDSQQPVNVSSAKTVLPPIKDTDIKLPPIPSVPAPSDSRPQHHRRFHLAKIQGLTSAPPGPIRLGNYGNRSGGGTHSNELSGTPSSSVQQQSADKGMLMVKHETNEQILGRIHHQQESK